MTMTEDYATTNGHDREPRSDATDTVTLDDGQGGEMTVARKAWKQIRSLVDVLDSNDVDVFDAAVALVIADKLKPEPKRAAAASTTAASGTRAARSASNGAKS